MNIKRLKNRALSLALSLAICASLLPSTAYARLPDVSNAFDEEVDKTFQSYADAFDWDLSKNGNRSWTSGITGEPVEWQAGYQIQYFYDNESTTAIHIWDLPGGHGLGGSHGSLGMPTGSGGNIVQMAESQLGIRESPPGSNHVGYVDWYNNWDGGSHNYSPWEWCCIFVVWCASHFDYVDRGSNGIFAWTASCTAQFNYMANTMGYSYCTVQDYWNGRQDEVLPGDIMFFSKTGNTGNMNHIGIVVEAGTDERGKYILTVEGNTNGSCAPDGVGTPGGGVSYQKYRPTTNYVAMQRGFILRPEYPTDTSPAPEEP